MLQLGGTGRIPAGATASIELSGPDARVTNNPGYYQHSAESKALANVGLSKLPEHMQLAHWLLSSEGSSSCMKFTNFVRNLELHRKRRFNTLPYPLCSALHHAFCMTCRLRDAEHVSSHEDSTAGHMFVCRTGKWPRRSRISIWTTLRRVCPP